MSPYAVALQAVSRWQTKIEAVEPDVQRVLAEEREETALRKAEMEANKAQVSRGPVRRRVCKPRSLNSQVQYSLQHVVRDTQHSSASL